MQNDQNVAFDKLQYIPDLFYYGAIHPTRNTAWNAVTWDTCMDSVKRIG